MNSMIILPQLEKEGTIIKGFRLILYINYEAA